MEKQIINKFNVENPIESINSLIKFPLKILIVDDSPFNIVNRKPLLSIIFYKY